MAERLVGPRSTVPAVATAVFLLVLIVASAVAHRGQIHAAGYHVTICTAQAERPGDSGIQTLTHVADCVQDSRQLRTEAGDLLVTILGLAFVGAGSRRLIHNRHH